jgi:histidinol-phosphate aminotransferase
MSTLLRREILDVPEYALTHHACRVKLNQNENPYELPPEIKEEILRAFAALPWSRYPEFVPQRQIERTAAFAGWTPAGTLLGNGSNDLLQLIFQCVLERGRTVVLSQPTFTLYRLLAQSAGATVADVPMTPTLGFDVDRIVATARSTSAHLVVLCSPNNPTGTRLGEEDVRRIVEQTAGLVVLDEAYVHFSGGSLVRLLDRHDRLIILQTFSKALGAASLRLGYALASPALTRQLEKVKLPYSVNAFTLLAAEILIERWPVVQPWIGRIVSERERVRAALTLMPSLRVHPSSANFLLFETMERAPGDLFDSLRAEGILIRNVSSYPMLSRALRVTVGTPAENDEFLEALQRHL